MTPCIVGKKWENTAMVTHCVTMDMTLRATLPDK
jgi:hypothetical protein